MSEKITSKRTSRVTFIGVSNLPQEKALKLRDILQNIIAHLSELHASCDDKKIQVDERFKKVKNLETLRGQLESLVTIAKDQVDLCYTENEIKSELQSVYNQIAGNTGQLLSLLTRFSSDSSSGAFQIVELLLNEVKLTVDLLRTADRYTIRRVEQMADEVADLANAVLGSKDIPNLVERATPLSRAAIEIARLAEQRAIALDQNNAAKEVKELLHRSSASVGSFTPQVILATKAAIASGGSRPADVGPLNDLQQALRDITHATRVAPEFAVIFDVDYLDTELGLRLAALAEAVRGGDRIAVASGAKGVDKEIERRIALAKKDPLQEPNIKAARAALAIAQSTAREALTTRLAHSEPHAGPYLAADARMTAEFHQLKLAAAALPDAAAVRSNAQIPLIQAAHALSLQLWSLLQQ